jgi:6-phosphogluconate dehydrogenase (decarboxylating)
MQIGMIGLGRMGGDMVRRLLNVDCSEKASCKGQEYQLWLQNRQALYGVENISIAPGYSESKSHR